MDDAEFDTPPGPISRPSDERIALVDSRLRMHEILRHLAEVEGIVDRVDGPEHAHQVARAAALWRDASYTASDMARELEAYLREGYVRAAAELAPTLRDTPAATALAPRRRRLRKTLFWIGALGGTGASVWKFIAAVWKMYHGG